MDFTSGATATLGIFTIARFAALAVLATEALFLWSRRREPAAERAPAFARIFWALTPAVILAGLCFWCTFEVSARRAGPAPVMASLEHR